MNTESQPTIFAEFSLQQFSRQKAYCSIWMTEFNPFPADVSAGKRKKVLTSIGGGFRMTKLCGQAVPGVAENLKCSGNL